MRSTRYLPTRFAAIGLLVVFALPAMTVGQSLRLQTLQHNPVLAKVSSHLLRARELSSLNATGAEIATAVPSLQFRGGLPQVAVRLDTLTLALIEKLRGRGLEIDSYHLQYGRAFGLVPTQPLVGCPLRQARGLSGLRIAPTLLKHPIHQQLSTCGTASGILVDVHPGSPSETCWFRHQKPRRRGSDGQPLIVNNVLRQHN